MLTKEKVKVSKTAHEESLGDRFVKKSKLNLNDLLKRRMEEKKIDKKTNLIIFSSATVVGAIVILVLSL